MRVFFCSFRGFSLAVPMHSVSSLTLQTDLQTEGHSQEDDVTHISLTRLFNLEQEDIRHSIVLKNPNTEDDEIADTDTSTGTGNKTILYIPEVECEAEIPEEEIYPIPAALSGTLFSRLFSGIKFDSRPAVGGDGGFPVLLLNPEQLIQSVQ